MAKRMDLVEELNAGRKIYVRNVSNPKGAVFLVLYDASQRPLQIQVPPSPHPFCLSDMATEFALNEGGSHLRTILNKSEPALKLISESKARKILEMPGVREELQASVDSISGASNAVKTYKNKRDPQNGLIPSIVGMDKFGKPVLGNAKPDHANGEIRMVKTEEDEDEGDISSQVKVIVAQINSKELSAKEGRVAISQISDTLSEADLAYITANTTGQVRDYATTLLARKRGLDDDEEEDDSEDDVPAVAPAKKRRSALDPSQIPPDLRTSTDASKDEQEEDD